MLVKIRDMPAMVGYHLPPGGAGKLPVTRFGKMLHLK